MSQPSQGCRRNLHGGTEGSRGKPGETRAKLRRLGGCEPVRKRVAKVRACERRGVVPEEMGGWGKDGNLAEGSGVPQRIAEIAQKGGEHWNVGKDCLTLCPARGPELITDQLIHSPCGSLCGRTPMCILHAHWVPGRRG